MVAAEEKNTRSQIERSKLITDPIRLASVTQTNPRQNSLLVISWRRLNQNTYCGDCDRLKLFFNEELWPLSTQAPLPPPPERVASCGSR